MRPAPLWLVIVFCVSAFQCLSEAQIGPTPIPQLFYEDTTASQRVISQLAVDNAGNVISFTLQTAPCCSTPFVLLFSQGTSAIGPVGNQENGAMKQKTDVLQGTLVLMVLKTLDVLGSLHGYGIARRIEQISGDLLAVNQGTLYPVVLKLENEGLIASEWGASENNRRARFYRLTARGRRQLHVETQDWKQTADIIGRFFGAKEEDFS